MGKIFFFLYFKIKIVLWSRSVQGGQDSPSDQITMNESKWMNDFLNWNHFPDPNPPDLPPSWSSELIDFSRSGGVVWILAPILPFDFGIWLNLGQIRRLDLDPRLFPFLNLFWQFFDDCLDFDTILLFTRRSSAFNYEKFCTSELPQKVVFRYVEDSLFL